MKDKNEVATITRPGLMAKMGARYSVDPGKLYQTLKATAFKGGASEEQLMALMIVADQYGLNPFTKEIYAFPDRQNGIVPVVGVDGWSRIINGHPEFDGMAFDQDDEACTCTIYRKDRAHPVTVTEYMSECCRDVGPWKSHPKRMLRHKAMIQCARLAFGYAGIYDADEAERIIEVQAVEIKEPITETREYTEKPHQTAQEPRKVVDATTDTANVVVGLVEDVSEKTGTGKKGDWKRYGIKIDGEYYNTFSDTLGGDAKDAKANGLEVEVHYEVNAKGYKDATALVILQDAGAVDTSTSDEVPY